MFRNVLNWGRVERLGWKTVREGRRDKVSVTEKTRTKKRVEKGRNPRNVYGKECGPYETDGGKWTN